MTDGAIDFRRLLREEKKKARQQHRQQQQLHQLQATGAVATASASASAKAVSSRIENKSLEEKKESNDTYKILPKLLQKKFAAIEEQNVEAIDFSKLVQEEQNRAARLRRESSVANALFIMTSNFNRQDFVVCSNPSCIFYVPHFLADDTNDGTALMEWLQSLPENPHSSQDNKSSSASQNQTANGAWTVMQYAKRRVALFDSTATNFQNPTNNGNDTSNSITNTNTNTNTNTDENNNTPDKAFFPRPLEKIVNALVDLGIFSAEEPPNHILINEYHPGQGILAHTDGPAYVSRTATLSLESDVLIHFTPRPNYYNNNNKNDVNREPTASTPNSKATITTNQQQQPPPPTITVRLNRGSLVVFEDDAYLEYCHGIADRILQEQVTEQCVNAAPHEIGTIIERGYRISLTFRHKKSPQS